MGKLLGRQGLHWAVSGIVILLIYIFTFPKTELDYGIGLDSSYIWAMNHLFFTDYQQLLQTQYPYGPLTVLKQPTIEGNGLIYHLFFFTFVKLSYLFLFLRVSKLTNSDYYLLTFPLVILVSLFIRIDMLVIANVALLLFSSLQKKQAYYFYLAALLASIGFFIKSSIGVISFSMFPIAFLLFQRKHEGRYRIEALWGSFGIFLFVGILVFRDFEKVFYYCSNVLHLMSEYSSLALFPNNNWWALAAFLIAIFAFPFLHKSKPGKQAFYILLPSLFFMWKHAMSREDHTHNAILFPYLILFWSLIFIFSERKTIALLLLPIISLFGFYTNMKEVSGFQLRPIDYQGFNHFNRWILHTQKAKETEVLKVDSMIAPVLLDKEILGMIGQNTIDTYPWELSYIAANHLNWQPRTTLQNGHFGYWYDQTTGPQFSSKNGPEFVLFHTSHREGQFVGIDNKYLLNDGPFSNYEIFNNYKPVAQRKDFILYQKVGSEQLTKQLFKEEKTTWNEWLSVPIQSTSILRAKVAFKEKPLLKIKNIFYKGQPYYIDYLTSNHQLFSRRFVPSLAKEGLWINPMIQDTKSNHLAPMITQIRFWTPNPSLVSDIDIQWEQITKKGTTPYGTVYALFDQHPRADSILLDTLLQQSDQITPRDFLSDSPTYTQEYSYGLQLDLDTFWHQGLDSVRINYQAIFNSSEQTDALLVISIDNIKDQWFSKKLYKNVEGGWNFVRFSKTFHAQELPDGKCTLVLWNINKEPIQVSEARAIVDLPK